MLILDFFPYPRWGKILIETVIKNGSRAPEERKKIINSGCKWNLMG